MAKPTLIYDGECGFCSRWIERWRLSTGDQVDYVTSQEAASKFPEISEGEFAEAVQWVGADGERLSGAPAVFAASGHDVGSRKSPSNALWRHAGVCSCSGRGLRRRRTE